MHDYDPSWDCPTVEPSEIQGLDEADQTAASHIIDRVRAQLAPALGLANFEVFYVEACGIDGGAAHAVYCNGTASRPIVGLDLLLIKQACDEEGESFARQLEIALAHELAHAYQESIGLDHEHDHGFDEDDAEEFAREWTDWRAINLHLLNPELAKPSADPTPAAAPIRRKP